MIKYKDNLHKIFWFMVSPDGSIYLDPYDKNKERMKFGRIKPKKGLVPIYFKPENDLTNKKLIKKAHFSYHASGEIHMQRYTFRHTPLNNLKKQFQFCTFLFTHPDNYPIIDKPKESDIHLDFIPTKPLEAHFFVSKKENWSYVNVAERSKQDNRLFVYSKLNDVPDLVYQLVVFDSYVDRWQSGSVVSSQEIK